MTNITDEKYMARTLTFAKHGLGFVSPNPLVGCVIVKKGKVLAEGWHKKYGGEHAEIEAMRKLGNKEIKKLRDCTVYVNLEPCFHFCQTPPCVEALIAAGVKRVVIGMKDPNPLVNGKSIKKLRKAGIEVEVGVLKEECEELNEAFTKWITTGRPFVLLKCAVTLDGALTLKKGAKTPLGCPETMRRVHELRGQYDAIAVGVNTVLIDDPRLTCRIVTPSPPPPTRGRMTRARNPVRVIFDTHLRTPENARMFRQPGKTIILTGPKFSEKKLSARGGSAFGGQKIRINYKKLEVIKLPADRSGRVSLKAALKWLGKHGITSIMVEGGAELATSFLEQQLVDKVILVITPHLSSDPAASRLFPAFSSLPLLRPRCELVGGDAWLTAYLN